METTNTGGLKDKSRARLMKELRTKVFANDRFCSDLKWFMHQTSHTRERIRESESSVLKFLPHEGGKNFSVYHHDHYSQPQGVPFSVIFSSLAEEREQEKLCAGILSFDGGDSGFKKAVEDFVRKYPQLFIHNGWHLLMFKGGIHFYAVRVFMGGNGLFSVFIDNFDYKSKWRAAGHNYRVIVPKLSA